MRIKLPLSQIQYLREVLGFRSAGHIYIYIYIYILHFALVSVATAGYYIPYTDRKLWIL